MPHHQTRDTVAITKFCTTCNRTTLHAVSGKRIGHCIEHEPKKQEQKEPPRESQQARLF